MFYISPPAGSHTKAAQLESKSESNHTKLKTNAGRSSHTQFNVTT